MCSYSHWLFYRQFFNVLQGDRGEPGLTGEPGLPGPKVRLGEQQSYGRFE